MSEQILDSVKSKYGAVAESTLSSNHAGVKAVAEAFGYTAEELTSIPAEANMGLSCGNPTATANLRPGEVVVDLGSGGGLDVFLASKMVGPEGRAIGIDMTPAMIERARANAAGGRIHQRRVLPVHHRPDSAARCLGRLRHLQLRHQSRARQARRLPRDRPCPQARWPCCRERHRAQSRAARSHRQSIAAYVGCIAGAIRIEDYRAGLLAAGFEHVEIVDSGADLNAYAKVENQSGCCSPAMDAKLLLVCRPRNLTATSARRTLRAPREVRREHRCRQRQGLCRQAQGCIRSSACCGPSCCA